jgi:hypothetical protein
MTEKRAVREFAANGEVLKVADAWALRQGYGVVDESVGSRLYRKGAGIFTGARMVEIRTDERRVHLEAWVAANLGARIGSLFILPPEITIESGGPKAALPRKLGRGEVNELLEEFLQQPVE